MAKETGLTQTAVYSDLAGFRVAASPSGFLEAVEGPAVCREGEKIVGLYLNPPERAVVLCVDQKSQIQTLDRTHRSCR